MAYSVQRKNPNYKTVQQSNPEDHNMATAFLWPGLLTRADEETDLSGV
jgi:hypothetical protein